jgi:hypothetical protein
MHARTRSCFLSFISQPVLPSVVLLTFAITLLPHARPPSLSRPTDRPTDRPTGASCEHTIRLANLRRARTRSCFFVIIIICARPLSLSRRGPPARHPVVSEFAARTHALAHASFCHHLRTPCSLTFGPARQNPVVSEKAARAHARTHALSHSCRSCSLVSNAKQSRCLTHSRTHPLKDSLKHCQKHSRTLSLSLSSTLSRALKHPHKLPKGRQQL